jgi:Mce-associated membrane protein
VTDTAMGGVPRSALVALAVVAVCATAATAAGAVKLSDHGQKTALRTQVLAAGRQIAVDFAVYDYRHIDADFSRVANESTGKFKSQFVTQSAGVRELIIKAKAVSKAEIAAEGLVEANSGHASVVVALDRTVTNTSAPKGQRDSFGLQIDLVNVNGKWLASGVKPL